MLFTEQSLPGIFIVSPERREDSRGYFTRTFCRDEFTAHGLASDFVQCNASYNARRGTLRGMHRQLPPYQEIKLVRCTRGAIWDVVLDLRPQSPTVRQWLSVELTEDNGCALYVPGGFAHGFQTLTDGAEVFYQMAECYYPDADAGVRWDDKAFAIDWPIRPPILSNRDAAYQDYHLRDARS
ncbi:MAG TPA: dTDP-4-dehydrorhamnose 3,5-epimerase [Acetobacteraceae bacterium]|nr:dTDP-4-dehydrorhamnose 3,5-epimerase [Acetobacteraceae bacterium]